MPVSQTCLRNSWFACSLCLFSFKYIGCNFSVFESNTVASVEVALTKTLDWFTSPFILSWFWTRFKELAWTSFEVITASLEVWKCSGQSNRTYASHTFVSCRRPVHGIIVYVQISWTVVRKQGKVGLALADDTVCVSGIEVLHKLN